MAVHILQDKTPAERWCGTLRAYAISIFLFGTILPLNLLQVLSLVILPFSKAKFRDANTFLAGMWWSWCVNLSKKVGTKFLVSGDPIPDSENALVFANHQQQTDIIVLLALGQKAKRIRNMKWFAKKPLKYVPGIGWGLRFLDALFVERNWHSDAKMIQATFRTFIDNDIPIWLVTFAEGTRITADKLAASRSYAAKAGLPLPEYVLIPRTKGIVAAVAGLRSHIKAVYDVTIGYPQGIPGLWQWMRGRVKEVQIHVRRFPIDNISTDAAALSRWILERFVEKDRMLDRLYSAGSLTSGSAQAI